MPNTVCDRLRSTGGQHGNPWMLGAMLPFVTMNALVNQLTETNATKQVVRARCIGYFASIHDFAPIRSRMK